MLLADARPATFTVSQSFLYTPAAMGARLARGTRAFQAWYAEHTQAQYAKYAAGAPAPRCPRGTLEARLWAFLGMAPEPVPLTAPLASAVSLRSQLTFPKTVVPIRFVMSAANTRDLLYCVYAHIPMLKRQAVVTLTGAPPKFLSDVMRRYATYHRRGENVFHYSLNASSGELAAWWAEKWPGVPQPRADTWEAMSAHRLAQAWVRAHIMLYEMQAMRLVWSTRNNTAVGHVLRRRLPQTPTFKTVATPVAEAAASLPAPVWARIAAECGLGAPERAAAAAAAPVLAGAAFDYALPVAPSAAGASPPDGIRGERAAAPKPVLEVAAVGPRYERSAEYRNTQGLLVCYNSVVMAMIGVAAPPLDIGTDGLYTALHDRIDPKWAAGGLGAAERLVILEGAMTAASASRASREAFKPFLYMMGPHQLYFPCMVLYVFVPRQGADGAMTGELVMVKVHDNGQVTCMGVRSPSAVPPALELVVNELHAVGADVACDLVTGAPQHLVGHTVNKQIAAVIAPDGCSVRPMRLYEWLAREGVAERYGIRTYNVSTTKVVRVQLHVLFSALLAGADRWVSDADAIDAEGDMDAGVETAVRFRTTRRVRRRDRARASRDTNAVVLDVGDADARTVMLNVFGRRVVIMGCASFEEAHAAYTWVVRLVANVWQPLDATAPDDGAAGDEGTTESEEEFPARTGLKRGAETVAGGDSARLRA